MKTTLSKLLNGVTEEQLSLSGIFKDFDKNFEETYESHIVTRECIYFINRRHNSKTEIDAQILELLTNIQIAFKINVKSVLLNYSIDEINSKISELKISEKLKADNLEKLKNGKQQIFLRSKLRPTFYCGRNAGNVGTIYFVTIIDENTLQCIYEKFSDYRKSSGSYNFSNGRGVNFSKIVKYASFVNGNCYIPRDIYERAISLQNEL